MAKAVARRKRPSKKGKKTEETDGGPLKSGISKKKSKEKHNSDFYMAGPALALPIANTKRGGQKNPANLAGKNEESLSSPSSSGKGTQSKDRAHANSLTLQGRTDATFDGGSFETRDVRVTRAEGCDTCEAGQCVRVRGVLVARYRVTTTVTLPSVNDFPDLTACQRQRVQDAIDNVLAPHEQEHVRAFEQYNGVTRTPFDITLCRSEFDSTIQEMFEQQASDRRDRAQTASDALDPFNFDVDLDCEDESSSTGGSDQEIIRESAPLEEESLLQEGLPENAKGEGKG